MQLQLRDGVGVLEIDTANNNAINWSFVAELNHQLEEIEMNAEIKAVLLTARHATMFSPGLDLVYLHELSYSETRNFMIDFGKLYLRLFSLPKPLVVAVGGHAIAGGLLLAMTGDVRLVKAGDLRLGLTEIDLGIPVPPGAIEMLRYYLNNKSLEHLLYTGRVMTATEAHALRIVDAVIEPSAFPQTAFDHALQLAKKPAPAFRKMKEFMREEYIDRIERRDEEHLDSLLDLLTSEEARFRLQMVVAKLKNRPS